MLLKNITLLPSFPGCAPLQMYMCSCETYCEYMETVLENSKSMVYDKHIWIIFCICSVLHVVACSNVFLIQQWAIMYSVPPLRAVFNSPNTYEPIHPPQSHHASACSLRAHGPASAGLIGVSNASPIPRSSPAVLESSFKLLSSYSASLEVDFIWHNNKPDISAVIWM